MSSINIKDRIRGSLMGGAVGDALGYPVEFMTYNQIRSRYGNEGITRFQLNDKGVAEISDDTQMTLFTANGLLRGLSAQAASNQAASLNQYIREAYIEWLRTQAGHMDATKEYGCWISRIKELYAQRAPGNTCLLALHAISNHHEAINNSKGCGGVMRIAPIPLYYGRHMEETRPDDERLKSMMLIAGNAAAITHKHPLGYLPAALLAHLIGRLLCCSSPTSHDIASLLTEGLCLLKEIYPACPKELAALTDIIMTACKLSASSLTDAEAIRQIGEGWVAEETLAIAVFCTMRHTNDFEQALIASVNHSGDSDSTGAVTGNIIGTVAGYDAIPHKFTEHLELRQLIEEMADDLANGIPPDLQTDKGDSQEKRLWLNKYVSPR